MALRARDRPVDEAAILLRRALRRHIGTIDWQMRDHLLERLEHTAQGEIAGRQAGRGKPVQFARQHVHLAREIEPHDALLALVEDPIERSVTSRVAMIEAIEPSLAARIDEQA